MLTRGQLWRAVRDAFAAAGIETAGLDARVLICHSLRIGATELIASEGEPVGADERAGYEVLVARRLAREPVARIVGRQEFYGLDFGLNPATLVPRPETEMLVDFGIGHLKGHEDAAILDLGSGTGCIVLALLANLQDAKGVGVDLAAEAVLQARANAEALGLGARFEALEGDWFAPVAGRKFDLILSNPPYIARDEIEGLAPEVARFDPALALDGGLSGLDPYRIITAKVLSHLRPGGAVAVEIGFDQGEAVANLFRASGLTGVEVEKDLAGHHRMVAGYAP
ncbi:peptide chain release factor N(5)-glutamine methyltransferase [Pelagibacterium limicola]|uniref:peptide chain release factor N(5)-glutamine methyltransferase n=1 Tax=Pelagibacterium limicola TaxID=2791022 RepID=UPI0018AFD334|nr:peptide chain release factor N(5)-glutamine methyltransferase [Pelagibacterium limicola]